MSSLLAASPPAASEPAASSIVRRRSSFFISTFPIENHAAMMKIVVFDKGAIGGEAGIVPIVDMIAAHLVAALIGALALAARFVIAAIGQKLLPDMTIGGDPHADIGMLCHDI